MDQFGILFTFYGLLLGLAATEIISSLGLLAREGSLRALRPRVALLAFLTFILLCATWIDAYTLRDEFTLDLQSLWAPIGAATAYYLAAVVVLPKRMQDWQDVEGYFDRHRIFVVVALIAAELFGIVMYLPHFGQQLAREPMVFWLLGAPLHVAILATFGAMLLARGRRAQVIAISAQIAIFAVPYWSYGFLGDAVRTSYGYTRTPRTAAVETAATGDAGSATPAVPAPRRTDPSADRGRSPTPPGAGPGSPGPPSR